MNSILLAVVLVASIGLIAGVGLAVASVVMAVPKDETAEAVRECLPGANCGACGYSGCDGYAAALSKGETKKNQPLRARRQRNSETGCRDFGAFRR